MAVIDADGRIVAVNAEWLRFGAENGATNPSSTGVGANYLAVCRASMTASAEARAAATSLSALLEGKGGDFDLEYPCDSGTERRWFLMQVRAIAHQGAVVSHVNITRRKVLELELRAQSSLSGGGTSIMAEGA